MIFMLDNYDSFTYNLVQYLGELGAELKVARNDEVSVDDVMGISPEGIVLSPGPGRPEKGGIMQDLVVAAAGNVPLLGVCLGHQCIGAAFGGVVERAPHLMHGKTSMITHDGSALFEGIGNPFEATRYHSLIVREEGLPACLAKTAWADDGLLMGIRHTEYPVWGVQFHPESILTGEGKKMLGNFLGAD